MVQPRPDGTEAARAAYIALRTGGVAPEEIDYVNAHASSTPIGDLAEARVIGLALGRRAADVPVSGTKALYGHPLGASGAIEAALCALTIARGLGAAIGQPGRSGRRDRRAAAGPPPRRPTRHLPASPLNLVRLRRPQRGARLRGTGGLRAGPRPAGSLSDSPRRSFGGYCQPPSPRNCVCPVPVDEIG